MVIPIPYENHLIAPSGAILFVENEISPKGKRHRCELFIANEVEK